MSQRDVLRPRRRDNGVAEDGEIDDEDVGVFAFEGVLICALPFSCRRGHRGE